MNEQPPTGTLPDLSQASIDRMERAVFAEIAADRPAAVAAAPPRSRRRGWLTGIGIAAAFVVGMMITPAVFDISTPATTTADGVVERTSGGGGNLQDGVVPEMESAGSAADSAASVAMDAPSTAEREIIASAQATVRVGDIATAVDEIAALAAEHGGYVESTDVSVDPQRSDTSMPAEYGGDHGWISIRVPSADLTDVIDVLGDSGTVISSSISQQDVTSVAIDLRARVDATKASVDRLTELMSQSGSVSELIEAEIALTDRQAQLESYTQQLAALDDQVAMSSLNVQLTEQTTTTSPEPNGFLDGLLAGWNGLIVSLNALVLSLGFLLPWLIIAGAVALLIWLIRRRRQRANTRER